MARYETVTKAERNRAVVATILEHPDWSTKEVGERFGITGVRVGAILKRAGYVYDRKQRRYKKSGPEAGQG